MISAANLYEDIRYLTKDIGVRLAGSEEERRGAEYLRDRFLQYVPKCELEEFPVAHQIVEQVRLEFLINGGWVEVPATLFNGAPTTDGKTVEAELVFFDSHADYQRPDLSYLQGKAVIHYGLRYGSEENYRRLMDAKPAFLLMVDTRYTSHVPLGDGMFPAYVEKYGAVTTMNVAFFDAWEVLTKGAIKARLNVKGQTVPGISRNVVAELPGTSPEPLYFYVGGHVDTQAASVGADDNAVGCAVAVELARVLSQQPLRHTVRFIAFGAEEQLSVGSAQYVKRHRTELAGQKAFVCNFDSCASAVGWNHFVIDANAVLREQIETCYHSHDVYYLAQLDPDPCNDLFPFTAAGVPGITLMRRNCETGKFYHHQPSNDLSVISADVAAQLAEASAALIRKLDAAEFDHKFTTEASTAGTVAELWQQSYGGWN